MGWLEYVIVTPAHHRVHHAINPEYLDKNYGQIFIFWDRLFGTFQEERDDIPAVYGITRPVRTWNPIKINFLHLWSLIQDAWHAKSWIDKLRIWFMPLGWRPENVIKEYPIYKIEDVYDFEHYKKEASPSLRYYLWGQLFSLLLIVSYLYSHIASIGTPNIFIYGAFIFVYVYALTDLMDGSKYAFVWEIMKTAFGLGIIYFMGDWFGASKHIGRPNLILVVYFIISLVVTIQLNTGKQNIAPTRTRAI